MFCSISEDVEFACSADSFIMYLFENALRSGLFPLPVESKRIIVLLTNNYRCNLSIISQDMI